MKKILIASTLFTCVVSMLPNETFAAVLSKNEQLFREDIQYRLPTKPLTQINNVITNYKAKIATMNKTDANRLTDSILKKIDSILYKMSAAQPLDKSLSQKADSKYLTYTLLKFELMLLK